MQLTVGTANSLDYSVGTGAGVAPFLVAFFLADFFEAFAFFLGDFLAAFLPAAFFLVDFAAAFLAAFFFFAISSGSFRCSARITSIGLSPRGAETVGERHSRNESLISAARERC